MKHTIALTGPSVKAPPMPDPVACLNGCPRLWGLLDLIALPAGSLGWSALSKPVEGRPDCQSRMT